MKISIVGAGKVGVAVASHILTKTIARELVLVSRDLRRAQGEAMDLAHAQALHPVPARVTAGGVAESAGSDLLIVCASVTLDPGELSRLTLGPRNTRLFESLLPPLLDASPNAILLMVSNPVDVLTWQALRICGWPASRVFGTGTLLDSVRYRRALSDELAIHPDDLRAYILGEHGESQFPAMSMAMAGAERIDDTPARRRAFQECAVSGITIYQMKGHTSHGIAAATAAIAECIARDEKRTMPLSVLVPPEHGIGDVCLSLPVVLGACGIDRVLHPALNADESAALRHSATIVRAAIDACEAPPLSG